MRSISDFVNMNDPATDPDDLVRKKIDLNHITNMSESNEVPRTALAQLLSGYQMHVPDSITVGPHRSHGPRLHQGDDQIPVRMDVPERLRPGQ